MSEESLYEVLGVEETASTEEITAAYQRLVRQTHPDVGGNDYLFRHVREAYETLSKAKQREEYDRHRSHPGGGVGDPATSAASGWDPAGDSPPGWSSTDDSSDPWSNVSHEPAPGAGPRIAAFAEAHPWTVTLVASMLVMRVAPVFGVLMFLLSLVAAIGTRRAARQQAHLDQKASPVALFGRELAAGFSMCFTVFIALAAIGSDSRSRRRPRKR